ncbi:MAG: NADH-quinone oxidoreductase subunit L [Deinococcales bacterium]
MILPPILGWVLLIGFGKRLPEPTSGYLASAMVLASFVLAVFGFFGTAGLAEGKQWHVQLWEFLPFVGGENKGLYLGFALDQLSSLMTLIITGIGFLIHVFAIGYMHGDDGFSRFFAYLNFFIAFMLVLVLGDSLPILFIGWEGVGVASFLLIGFWYKDFRNSDAARKAFVVNRIGDAFLMLGMFLLFKEFGTLNLHELKESFGSVNVPLVGQVSTNLVAPGAPGLELACLFLLLGAAGKSAQLPLSTWLPDAMAGPTPVSALIHAATMVTAGVYLVARASELFANAPLASSWVAWVGAATAVFGAISAMAQIDIKKILAYSTVSQLGFMFVAVGCGAYWAGIFHVLTHAFFKALLFLSSGSVIHALEGEQDVRKMGGLRKVLPTTHLVSFIGALAIMGVPLLSGFFSKDAILESVLKNPFLDQVATVFLFAVMVIVAAMTAAYMWRWYALVFLGEYRGHAHPHESGAIMTTPLLVLAGLSVVGGFIGLPHFLGKNVNLIEPFLEKVAHNAPKMVKLEGVVEFVPLIFSIVAVLVGYFVGNYFFRRDGAKVVAEMPNSFGHASRNALFLDKVYDWVLGNPARVAATFLGLVDKGAVQGGGQWLGEQVGEAGSSLSVWQAGFARGYAMAVLIGTVALLGFLILRGFA